MVCWLGALAVGGVLGWGAGAATAQCVGDCSGGGRVAVNNVITLVNIALGTLPPSACAHGIPSGAAVTVAVIIQAVTPGEFERSEPGVEWGLWYSPDRGAS